MVSLGKRELNEAREIARWLHENVAPGDHGKPTHVSVISRTCYWNSSDKSSWEVKHFGVPGTVSVSGIPDDQLLIFLLRFN